MRFLPALDILQEKGSVFKPENKNQEKNRNKKQVLGIFQTRKPADIIVWDRQTHQFRTFYTNKIITISRDMLFDDDWDIIYFPETPMKDFTEEIDND